MRLDPWASTQFQDYSKLKETFGIDTFEGSTLPEPSRLMRRNVVFGHRGFGLVERAIRKGEPFVMMTGLVPSGKMHLGHKMVVDQMRYFQRMGGVLYIAVADLEGLGARNMSLEEGARIAREEYIRNYLALGIDPEKSQVYFQSRRQEVKDLMYSYASRVNWSELKAIYGFEGSTNIAHVVAPLVQAADILHPQLPGFSGTSPTVVPVGVDQDPHIRLTRDIAARFRTYNVQMTEKGVGIFILGSDNPEKPLQRAQSILGPDYGKTKMNVKYRALYLLEASEGDIVDIDVALTVASQKAGDPGYLLPASTYHRFQTGLDGGKMSSSRPESAIYLTDEKDVYVKKLRSAKTGGRVSAEEQKEHGGLPQECTIYEMYVYHLIEDDDELASIFEECTSGSILCGACKQRCIDRTTDMMEALRERRESITDVDIDAIIK